MRHKVRKARTTGSDLNFDVSHIFGWPPDLDTPAYEKLCRRIAHGQCIGCGQQECQCKSGHVDGPDWKRNPYVMNNFWRKGEK